METSHWSRSTKGRQKVKENMNPPIHGWPFLLYLEELGDEIGEFVSPGPDLAQGEGKQKGHCEVGDGVVEVCVHGHSPPLFQHIEERWP